MNETFIFIWIFRVFAISHLKKTPEMTKTKYILHKAANIIVLSICITDIMITAIIIIMSCFHVASLFRFLYSILRFAFMTYTVVALILLYRVSKTGYLQLQSNGKLQSIRNMRKKWIIICFLILPPIIPIVYNVKLLFEDMGTQINKYCINGSNSTSNSTGSKSIFDNVFNGFLCVSQFTNAFSLIVDDVVLYIIPAYIFFWSYITSGYVSTFKKDLEKKLTINFNKTQLYLLRKEYGNLTENIECFYKVHKFIISISILTGVASISLFGYLIIAAIKSNKDYTWTYLYIPSFIINYFACFCGPSILHSNVSMKRRGKVRVLGQKNVQLWHCIYTHCRFDL